MFFNTRPLYLIGLLWSLLIYVLFFEMVRFKYKFLAHLVDVGLRGDLLVHVGHDLGSGQRAGDHGEENLWKNIYKENQ